MSLDVPGREALSMPVNYEDVLSLAGRAFESSGLTPGAAALLAAVLFGAGIVSGLSGFAFSAVAACILWLLPPLQAVPLLMALSACNRLLCMNSLRRDLRMLPSAGMDGALPYIAGGLIGLPLGLYLLSGMPTARFSALLGTFLVAYSTFALFRPATLKLAISGWRPAVVVGALGGVVGGFSAFPSSMPVVYFGLRGKDKAETRGVVEPYILSLQLVSLLTLSIVRPDVFDPTFWALLCVSLPITLLGATLGVACYRRLSETHFRKVVLVLLSLSGVSLIVKTVTG